MRRAHPELEVRIVSRDKDLTQLIGTRDTYWDAVADVRYGYDDIAARMHQDTRRLIEAGGFREYFHPQTGEGLGVDAGPRHHVDAAALAAARQGGGFQ